MGWWYLPAWSLITRAGAVVFGLFFITAFTLRRMGVSDDVTVRVAGTMAWVFLAFTVVVLVTERRRARERARRAVAGYLRRDAGVIARVGTPVDVVVPNDATPPPDGEWGVPATVSGPLGSVDVTTHMRRRGNGWEGTAWDG